MTQTHPVINPLERTHTRLIGAHMPTSGGIQKSLLGGKEIGCTVVQLFTGSPRQWSHPELTEETVQLFRNTHAETGIQELIAHDSYLINLAAPDPAVMNRSRGAFRGELDRASRLGISWVVTHMGAHLNQGEDEAVQRLIESLKLILDETDALGWTAGIALETTAGQGTGLGWKFEQLGTILKGVGDHPRLGVCLDTCHIFVAGNDIRDDETFNHTIEEFDRLVGLKYLKVIHANDSVKGLGSRVDRHAHLGEGTIGIEAFRLIATDPRLLHVPIVVETPDSETMHAVNVAKLARLASGIIGIQLQLHGSYSDITPDSIISLELPAGSTLSQLVEAATNAYPKLEGIRTHCRFAIKETVIDEDAILHEGDVIAVLPPSSGG